MSASGTAGSVIIRWSPAAGAVVNAKTATSLKIAAGASVGRPELATAILRELDADYARVCGGEFAEVADEWEAGCSTIGRERSANAGT